ncbi:arsenate-mycothiol transferase ArsC [Rhizobium sp. LEGMi198b]|uniref:arsenate-mycothiol transferase ArsC n=1 Tax=unclassified Rhizobium TaxID=2613769 RepID=UPI000CDF42FF|nr:MULTISPECIES: low molecular weight phosphatase family protein [Rhizobium]AVA23033.1 protein-tyrosine-phosphatase protein [Rhizobium sp. NXC24]MDK4741869.1 low molecular weight phosphatase family protein [Rhizobium sp. CNPSo 3464]UWU20397.1 low molecular weight phosphatase family protein [Rhizobium tropici]WFU01217.1 low molecular weight phosphatase family protein [Rhizobium sp. CB3171]
MEQPKAIEHNGKPPGAILFMCGLNTIRSPMAEAIARGMLPQGTYVASAGVRAGERNPFVDVVLGEIGLSLGRRQPQTLEELEDDFFDVIITLSPEAHHAALELTRANAIDVIYWPTIDPSVAGGTREQILNAYREVRDYLLGLIESRLVEHRGSL